MDGPGAYFAEDSVRKTNLKPGGGLNPDFHIAASQIERVDEEQLEVLKTSTEILAELWEAIQQKYWFMSEEYLGRAPKEQWKIQLHDRSIQVYNFIDGLELKEDHLQSIANYLYIFESKFLGFFSDKFSAITIREPDNSYIFTSTKAFDEKGEMHADLGIMELSPVCFQGGTNNMGLPLPESIVIHELAHMGLDEALATDWEMLGLEWQEVWTDDDGVTEYRSNNPEKCTSKYGEIGGVYEDIADSLVAYLMHGSLSAEKRDVIAQYERWLPTQSSTTYVVEKILEPSLPELPEELTYFLNQELADPSD